MKPTKDDSSESPTTHEVPTVTTPTAPDPFDPASLRLAGDFATATNVKKLLLTVPVRKPDKTWFVRTHPHDDYRINTAVIELKEDRETYLVHPNLWPELATESTFSPRALVTAINRQGVLFIWPSRMPGTDGKFDEWGRSMLEATELARCDWVRMTANMSLGAYEIHAAAGNLAEPEWPTTPFKELLRLAFKDRFVDSIDHPVLRKLRGEM